MMWAEWDIFTQTVGFPPTSTQLPKYVIDMTRPYELNINVTDVYSSREFIGSVVKG
jgi:hypothetical protein